MRIGFRNRLPFVRELTATVMMQNNSAMGYEKPSLRYGRRLMKGFTVASFGHSAKHKVNKRL